MKDLHIRSSQFELPQQYDTLKALCRCLRKGINREFFVIGATARDLLSVAMKVNTSKRTTKDLDICIAVESWDCFMEIQQKLMEVGFDKDPVRKQRFYYGDFELDVVPFGGLSDDGEKIYWPPEASPEMTVRGFESVLRECVKVVVDDGGIDFLIPTIAGLFITKLDAMDGGSGVIGVLTALGCTERIESEHAIGLLVLKAGYVPSSAKLKKVLELIVAGSVYVGDTVIGEAKYRVYQDLLPDLLDVTEATVKKNLCLSFRIGSLKLRRIKKPNLKK